MLTFHQFLTITEAVYHGNLGFMELVQFYKVATPAQKAHLDSLIKQNKLKDGWEFFQSVVGVKLK
jgi:hypothetical protein